MDCKNIFTFWEPKSKMPDYIRLCIKTWQKFLPEYRIHIVDYENLDYYLGKNFFNKILYTKFTLPKQADAIRCALLNKYGGIWLDADTIITSEKVKDFFNIKSDFILIGNHIGFIIANKDSCILKNWLFEIQRKIYIYSFFVKFPFLKIIFIRKYKSLKNWDIFGNSIIDKYLNTENNEIKFQIDRNKNNCLPELYFYPNSKNISHFDIYNKFYFDSFENNFDIKKTCILLLHNSWTPSDYKLKTVEEIANTNNTISLIFDRILDLKTQYEHKL